MADPTIHPHTPTVLSAEQIAARDAARARAEEHRAAHRALQAHLRARAERLAAERLLPPDDEEE